MENLIKLYPGLFRAIEIAKAGNHSVSVYFDKNYKNGFDDYKSIKNFCKNWFENFDFNGDIKVEIIKPTPEKFIEDNHRYETLNDISLRIEKSLKYSKPEFKLSNASWELLNKAIDKLDLSLIQIKKIKQIAVTIAQLDLSKTIEAYHVAESIHYSYVHCNDIYCNNILWAEQNSVVFGDKIEIKSGKIDTDIIKEAINYLNGLLQSKTKKL